MGASMSLQRTIQLSDEVARAYYRVQATPAPNDEDDLLGGSDLHTEGDRQPSGKTGSGKSHALAGVPKEYHEWVQLFIEEVTARAIPKHQPWDHEVELLPGKEPS